MKSRLVLSILVLLTTTYTFADYTTIVNNVLNDIQQSNTNKSDSQKKQNYQNYISKIEKLTSVDAKVKSALTSYLKAKINELPTTKNQNKGLGENTNIDQEKIRTTRLELHNSERATKELTPYTYDTSLEQTATTRAKYLSEINNSTHKRTSSDGYYSYESIKKRFSDQGIDFGKNENGASFSENIGRRIISCKETDCTTQTITALQKVFDFFMSEKRANGPHYKAVMGTQFQKIGVGIATNPSSKKIFVVTHYTVNF